MPKIIVAYNGTPHAEDALALARSLGVLLGAQVDLAHVHRADPHDRSPSATVRGREEFLRREGKRCSRARPSPAAPAMRSPAPPPRAPCASSRNVSTPS